ncbi:hypothetical protein LBMAG53_24550 [Planctomycetota bacterium]|nr:hypothetical protein LBMAG53_24550 [Planctomycetota bacterium]
MLRGDRPDNTTWTYAGAGEADGFLSLLVRGSWFVRAVHELIARQGNKCRIGRPALVMQLLRESSRLTTETVHRTSSACFSETIALYELLASGDECGNDSRIERVHAQLASVKPPDIAALAQEVGWTREHLTRRFAAVYGMPPVAWQRRWLIQRAAASLADGSATIKSVAAESGLPPDRFARLFHRLVGVSPSDYRDAPFPWS